MPSILVGIRQFCIHGIQLCLEQLLCLRPLDLEGRRHQVIVCAEQLWIKMDRCHLRMCADGPQ